MTPSEAFRRKLSEAAATIVASADLDGTLANVTHAAEVSWPAVRVRPDVFAAYLAERWPSDASDIHGGLVALKTADLYIACACATGDAVAIKAFEQAYFSEIEPSVVRVTRSSALTDEVAQVMRRKLFVSEGGPPKIAEYSGRGALRNWLRAAVVRTVLNLATRGPKEVSAPDQLLFAIPSPAADPEMAMMKQAYGVQFREVFRQAVEGLSAEDRNLLRYGFADGLSVDEIGALYGVHRATAARRLAKARATLLGDLRKGLLAQLRVDPHQLDSIMRMIRSGINLTLGAYLRDPPPD